MKAGYWREFALRSELMVPQDLTFVGLVINCGCFPFGLDLGGTSFAESKAWGLGKHCFKTNSKAQLLLLLLKNRPLYSMSFYRAAS